MQLLVYDGSYAGFFTTVFDVYEYKFNDVSIQSIAQRQDHLFGSTHIVHTDKLKAKRVMDGLGKKVSAKAMTMLYKTFLSGQKGMEDMLLQYVRYAFSNRISTEHDYSNNAVLYVHDMAKKVHREKHRMEAFVRFERTQDNIYYATIDPDFNVLPLIWNHFEKRYADQHWLIYDTRRKYGMYYDLQQTTIVEIDFNELSTKKADTVAVIGEQEELYRHLWKTFFDSVNIKARKNLKLHIKHMPKRYWRYLVEKW